MDFSLGEIVIQRKDMRRIFEDASTLLEEALSNGLGVMGKGDVIDKERDETS